MQVTSDTITTIRKQGNAYGNVGAIIPSPYGIDKVTEYNTVSTLLGFMPSCVCTP